MTFSDGCLGFEADPAQGCDDAIYPGAIVLLEHDREEARYHVSDSGRVVPVTFTEGQPTIEVNENVQQVQQDMREDVAENLGIDVSGVSIDSFRIVTWPDGCLGVYTDDAGCTEALVPDGFVAMLEADGELYRYHGSPDTFIGVEFLNRDVRLGEPLPPEKDPRDTGDSKEQDSGAYVPEGNDSALPQALVKDLAATLEVDPSEIEVRCLRGGHLARWLPRRLLRGYRLHAGPRARLHRPAPVSRRGLPLLRQRCRLHQRHPARPRRGPPGRTRRRIARRSIGPASPGPSGVRVALVP
ncbi:MAG: hypothetical protein U5Q44_12075 [Dehalococcoidia bacterium]|nr:hypothetical protein [Dehalococcoidia bacterium]